MFCHREFLHAQWTAILDDEFIDAWEHGIPVTCCDGIERRFYPRIFTHSGDYPEKYVPLDLLEVDSHEILQNPACKHQKPWSMSLPSLSHPVVSGTQPRDGQGYGAASNVGTHRQRPSAK
jgi:hypothetical protein